MSPYTEEFLSSQTTKELSSLMRQHGLRTTNVTKKKDKINALLSLREDSTFQGTVSRAYSDSSQGYANVDRSDITTTIVTTYKGDRQLNTSTKQGAHHFVCVQQGVEAALRIVASPFSLKDESIRRGPLVTISRKLDVTSTVGGVHKFPLAVWRYFSEDLQTLLDNHLYVEVDVGAMTPTYYIASSMPSEFDIAVAIIFNAMAQACPDSDSLAKMADEMSREEDRARLCQPVATPEHVAIAASAIQDAINAGVIKLTVLAEAAEHLGVLHLVPVQGTQEVQSLESLNGVEQAQGIEAFESMEEAYGMEGLQNMEDIQGLEDVQGMEDVQSIEELFEDIPCNFRWVPAERV